MNLTICLLLARRFVEREQIRELVEGYHGLSDQIGRASCRERV